MLFALRVDWSIRIGISLIQGWQSGVAVRLVCLVLVQELSLASQNVEVWTRSIHALLGIEVVHRLWSLKEFIDVLLAWLGTCNGTLHF